LHWQHPTLSLSVLRVLGVLRVLRVLRGHMVLTTDFALQLDPSAATATTTMMMMLRLQLLNDMLQHCQSQYF